MAVIFIGDADPFFLRLYAEILQRAGHQVTTAQDKTSFEAVLAEAPRFDVALVELAWLHGGGLAAARQLLALDSSPAVVGTGMPGDAHLIVPAFEAGVSDYLQKPIENEHLLALLRRLIERRARVDEAGKQVGENLLQLELSQVFKDGLLLLRTLDETALYDRLLQIAAAHTGCQGLALYVTKTTHFELAGYFGLIDGDQLPPGITLSELGMDRAQLSARCITVEQPLSAGEPFREVPPSEARGLVLTFALDNQPEGLLLATARLGRPFGENDKARAQLLAEISSVALANARRFTNERKLNLKVRGSSAYNMSFFVDYLGKELHKARRYHRPFALVQIVFDAYGAVSSSLGPIHAKQLQADIVRAMGELLRDADILARASDNEYMVLLPETDLFGARMAIGRMEHAFQRDPALAAAQKTMPLGVTIGFAAYPYDGGDIDSLMAASRRRLDEARRSAYRRLHLEDTTFYDAAQLLTSNQSPMRSFIDSPVDYGYTELTPPEVVALVREFLLISHGLPGIRSTLYWGVPEISREVLDSIGDLMLVDAPRALARLFLLGAKDTAAPEPPPGVTAVYLDAEQATRMGFVFSLSEHHAYSLVGRHLSVAPGEAFHTSDFNLALGLARKLQHEYNLQRWF